MNKSPKARIKKNVWDNWYGYLGSKRVIAFANTSEGTQEQNAAAWLKAQQKEESCQPKNKKS